MTTRAYDYILQLDDTTNFVVGNTIFGSSSGAFAEIKAIEGANIKVASSNTNYSFAIGEQVTSNSAILLSSNSFINHSANISGTSNVFATATENPLSDSVIVYVDGVPLAKDRYVLNANSTIQFLPVISQASSNNTLRQTTIFPTESVSSLIIQTVTGFENSVSFVASNLISYVETANAFIVGIRNSPYISEKNSYQQTAIVKLYSIYYPGEWYPPSSSGNPTKSGEGFPWPYTFPIRFAEVIGDTYSLFNYIVQYDGIVYETLPIDSGEISSDTTSTLNEIDFVISNFDGRIATLVDNRNIAGFNSSNSTIAFVNGALVQNIDPRTVESNSHYYSSVAAFRGANAVWDYESSISNGDIWIPLKEDSRDLLDAVVEIKYTYAKFLDHWPEYSVVSNSFINAATVINSEAYRVGDLVTSNTTSLTANIVSISGNTLYFDSNNLAFLPVNSKVLIKNLDADPLAHVKHIFTINKLNELDETKASFSLTSLFQSYKNTLPKRKFYTSTCPFTYKGALCKYPSLGTGIIVGSNPPITANGFFTISNASTSNISEDICAKTKQACSLRRNLVNFGGFPGVV
jgi:phage-related protein